MSYDNIKSIILTWKIKEKEKQYKSIIYYTLTQQ